MLSQCSLLMCCSKEMYCISRCVSLNTQNEVQSKFRDSAVCIVVYSWNLVCRSVYPFDFVHELKKQCWLVLAKKTTKIGEQLLLEQTSTNAQMRINESLTIENNTQHMHWFYYFVGHMYGKVIKLLKVLQRQHNYCPYIMPLHITTEQYPRNH